MKQALLLLLACLTIISSGCGDKQPPPKPQATIETDTESPSDTTEKAPSGTTQNTDIQLSEFTTFDNIYLDILSGDYKKWELKPVTLIAEVRSQQPKLLTLKTGNTDLGCGIFPISDPDSGDPIPDNPQWTPLIKYEGGKSYIFNLIIESIGTYESVWIMSCRLSEEFLDKEVFTFMTVRYFELLVEDLEKLTAKHDMLEWNVWFKAEVEDFTDNGVRLRTSSADILFNIREYPPTKTFDHEKYRIGEEHTFLVNQFHVTDFRGIKVISATLVPSD